MEAMFLRLLGRDVLEDIRRTPLCELRARLSSIDRDYGGIVYSDRSKVITSREVNALVDRALGYKE